MSMSLPPTPQDFDEAVDQFVNGRFYQCGYTAEEIVGKLKVSQIRSHPPPDLGSGPRLALAGCWRCSSC